MAQRWVRCVCGLPESQMVWAGLLHILFGWSSSVPWIFHPPPGSSGIKGECSIVVMTKVPKSNKSQRGPCITQGLLKLDSELAYCSCCFILWPKKVTWTNQSQCVEKHTHYLYREELQNHLAKCMDLGRVKNWDQWCSLPWRLVRFPLLLCSCSSSLGWAAKTERSGCISSVSCLFFLSFFLFFCMNHHCHSTSDGKCLLQFSLPYGHMEWRVI